jgi:tetratricopeptide (TPR) repeat protein
MKLFFYIAIVSLLSLYIISDEIFATTDELDQNEINVKQANNHFVKGEYKEAIKIYEQILDANPENKKIMNMKGIALSNLDYDSKSLKEFFKVLQQNPNDITALIGMGLGFGNLGEYNESSIYFNKALEQDPENNVIKNYKKIIDEINLKYRYTSTEKPEFRENLKNENPPQWFKHIVKWWTSEKINDNEFLTILEYMLEKDHIQVPKNMTFDNLKELKMLSWIRSNLDLWSQNNISDDEFYKNINWLEQNKFIKIKNNIKTNEELEYENFWFNTYLLDIKNNISKEKRYITYPNPSQDVIKKFLRDYTKWNYEQQVLLPSTEFPDPTYEVIDGIYHITYKIYLNEQPSGLPLDHKLTVNDSFQFWEEQELKTDNQDAKIKFEITKQKADASVWITWVVRDMGQGVLGHAHLGKGVVEVALGDYGCDGSFQLYDIKSVKTIMTHELGHSIGLPHTNDRTNIMYPSYTPSYAYCLVQ